MGVLSAVSAFNHERVPTSCLHSNLKPSKQIIGQIKYNRIPVASKLSPDLFHTASNQKVDGGKAWEG